MSTSSLVSEYQCFHSLTSLPAPPKGFFLEPSSSPSSPSPWLPRNLGRYRCPLARRAGETTVNTAFNDQVWSKTRQGCGKINEGWPGGDQTSVESPTSSKLSPTSATRSLWPLRCRTMAAFSEAYMQVKSNMATSGCP